MMYVKRKVIMAGWFIFLSPCGIRKKRPRLLLIHKVINCGEEFKETRYLCGLAFLGEEVIDVL